MCFLVFALLLGDGFSDLKKKKAKSHRERSWATASLTKKKMKKIYIFFTREEENIRVEKIYIVKCKALIKK
jgi:hypothetical protein